MCGVAKVAKLGPEDTGGCCIRVGRHVLDSDDCRRRLVEDDQRRHNQVPVVITSDEPVLSTARTSGIPHGQRPEHEPVVQSCREQVLFLKRGDLIMVQVDSQGERRRLHLGVTFDVTPRVVVSERPIAMPSPWAQPIADADAVQLLEVALRRELTRAEQFFAAVTMPQAWQRCGGGPVASISRPGKEDVDQCRTFAALFSEPGEKLRLLASADPAWASILSDRSVALTGLSAAPRVRL